MKVKQGPSFTNRSDRGPLRNPQQNARRPIVRGPDAKGISDKGWSDKDQFSKIDNSGANKSQVQKVAAGPPNDGGTYIQLPSGKWVPYGYGWPS